MAPPDVAKLDESPKAAENASLRERMEAHRSNPQCASCHQQMDAMGFALENFDAVGRYRTYDENFEPIDNTGIYADGTRIYENKGVLVLRTRWFKVVEQHDFFVDTQAIVDLDRALKELGVEAVPQPA